MPGEVEPHEAIEDGSAQIVLHPEAHATTHPAAHECEAERGERQDGQQHQPGRDRSGVVHDPIVDDHLLDDRADAVGRLADDRSTERQPHIAPMHREERPEPLHPTAFCSRLDVGGSGCLGHDDDQPPIWLIVRVGRLNVT